MQRRRHEDSSFVHCYNSNTTKRNASDHIMSATRLPWHICDYCWQRFTSTTTRFTIKRLHSMLHQGCSFFMRCRRTSFPRQWTLRKWSIAYSCMVVRANLCSVFPRTSQSSRPPLRSLHDGLPEGMLWLEIGLYTCDTIHLA